MGISRGLRRIAGDPGIDEVSAPGFPRVAVAVLVLVLGSAAGPEPALGMVNLLFELEGWLPGPGVVLVAAARSS